MKFITAIFGALISAPFLMQCTCTDAKPVATVGRFVISERDVQYRNAVTKIYFPEDKRDLGRDILIKSFTFAQILENNGHAISQDVLVREAKRINDTTLKPDMLQAIKDIFGADQESYMRDFVLPTYAERVLYYEFFLNSPKAQESSHQVAAQYLEDALARPDAFDKAPLKEGQGKNTFIVSMQEGLVWKHEDLAPQLAGVKAQAQAQQKNEVDAKLAEKANQQRSQEALKWKAEVVDALKPGQVFPKVMDLGESWLVARYLGPKKNKNAEDYQFEGVVFPKVNFDAWLTQEKEKVKVQMH